MNDISLSTQRMASAQLPQINLLWHKIYIRGRKKQEEREKKWRIDVDKTWRENVVAVSQSDTNTRANWLCGFAVCEFNFVFDGNPFACSKTISNCGWTCKSGCIHPFEIWLQLHTTIHIIKYTLAIIYGKLFLFVDANTFLLFLFLALVSN